MQTEKKILGVSKTVFTLGIVSFFTDISSEMLVPIIPQFLAFLLGGEVGPIIGLIEGIAESTASLLRVWAGYLCDRLGKPKLLTTIGYGLSALSKPFLINAVSWHQVLGVRFADRFGKGIRSAPRDVLIAENSSQESRGRAFGLHRSMDTAGATIGPLVIVIILMLLSHRVDVHNLGKVDRSIYSIIFIVASVPAVIGWLVLALFVPERKKLVEVIERPSIKLSSFSREYKVFLIIVTVFAIGNSSDAFLVLRATDKNTIGMSLFSFMWVYIVFNAIQAVVAYRSGVLSDKIGRKPIIIGGWLLFSITYFAIARITSQAGVWIWYTIYGVYYGMTEGLLRTLAVDLAPVELRGTAIGAFYTFNGIALLPASIIAGFLWKLNPSYPFYYGSATSICAAILLMFFVKVKKNA